MVDAGPQMALKGLDGFQGTQEMKPQFVHRVRTAVGQRVLGLGPNAFVGIEFRGIRRKGFEVEPFEPTTDFANGIAFVDPGIVPNDDHRAAKVLEQVAKKVTDLGVLDILFVQAIVQPEALTLRAHRETGNDGDPLTDLMMENDRSLPPRAPSFANRGDQQESGFVDEHEMGTQPCSVFFIRGHCFRFHAWMACSSRARARLSGFW